MFWLSVPSVSIMILSGMLHSKHLSFPSVSIMILSGMLHSKHLSFPSVSIMILSGVLHSKHLSHTVVAYLVMVACSWVVHAMGIAREHPCYGFAQSARMRRLIRAHYIRHYYITSSIIIFCSHLVHQ